MKNIKEKYKIVGKSIPRVDSIDKVTGYAKYIPDLKMPNMLYGSILRSSIPHGRIVRIDKSRAEKLPGVKAVITGEDIQDIPFGFQAKIANKNPLSKEKVRYVGEEIAAVAAISEEIAKEACSLIKVEMEPLPAVFDVESAMKPNAPIIHENCPNNIAGEIHKHFGDIYKAFLNSKYVIEGTYRTSAIPHVCMETRGALAYFDVSGNLTLWSTTQFPHILRIIMAKALNISERKIRVLKAKIGGGFGSRQSMDAVDPVCVYLAKIAQKPVRIIKDRYEEFISDRLRYPMIIKLKTGVNNKGKLLARKVEIITDAGAYNDQGIAVTASAASKITGLYRVPNIQIDGKIIFTNKVWGGAFRGYGNPQITFAIESQMAEIAEKLCIDPLEIRLLNVNQPGDITVAGAKFLSCGFEECLKKVSRSAGWSNKRNKIWRNNNKCYGIGMAGCIHTGGGGISAHGGNFSTAFIKIENDGSVDILTGVPDIGQGSDTVLSQIAAEELGVKIENIRIHAGDTDMTPCTQGVRGSRETFVAGNAVKLAAMKAKEELLKRARILMNIKEREKLKSANNKIFLEANPSKYITLEEVAGMTMYNRASAFPVGIPIVAAACYKDNISTLPDKESGYGNICPAWAFGAKIVELKVDKETGEVTIIKVTAAYDIGKAINPLAIKGQVEGGTAQGIGMALSEELVWENGVVKNANLADFKLQTIMDFPKEIDTILVETNDPNGPFGAKGVGEIVTVPTAAAVANAIYDAIGIRFKELPITREKILKSLKNREGKSNG